MKPIKPQEEPVQIAVEVPHAAAAEHQPAAQPEQAAKKSENTSENQRNGGASKFGPTSNLSRALARPFAVSFECAVPCGGGEKGDTAWGCAWSRCRARASAWGEVIGFAAGERFGL